MRLFAFAALVFGDGKQEVTPYWPYFDSENERLMFQLFQEEKAKRGDSSRTDPVGSGNGQTP